MCFITTSSYFKGDAGSIVLIADAMVFENNAEIAAKTNQQGDGGNIFINAPEKYLQNVDDWIDLNLDKFNNNDSNSVSVLSGASVTTSTNGYSNAGKIEINGQDLVLSNSAEISSKSTWETGYADAGTITIDVSGNIDLTDDSTITTAAEQSNAGAIEISADGEIRMSDSTISIQAGQGIVDGILKPGERFKLNHPTQELLQAFSDPVEPSRSVFERPRLQLSSSESIHIRNSKIDASAGLLAGTVSLTAADAIAIDNSSITLEVDQRNMDLANLWNAAEFQDREVFKQTFPALFSELTLEACGRRRESGVMWAV